MDRRAALGALAVAFLCGVAHARLQAERRIVHVEERPVAQAAPMCCGVRCPSPSDPATPPPPAEAWQSWWGFNCEPFLDLKAHVFNGCVQSSIVGCSFGFPQDIPDPLRPSEHVVQSKVVPALIKALRSEVSSSILCACLLSLAKIGEPATPGVDLSEVIRPWLASGNLDVQGSAALALGILGKEQDIPWLAAVLRGDGSSLDGAGIAVRGQLVPSVRAFAAYGLGLIGAETSPAGRRAIVTVLVETLRTASVCDEARDVQVACLNAMGSTPLPFDALTFAQTDLRWLRIPNVPICRAEQIGWLARYLSDAAMAELDRAQVPAALGRLLADAPIETRIREQIAALLLERQLANPAADTAVLQSSILALGKLGDCDSDAIDVSIRDALAATARNAADEQSRCFAFIALAQVASRPGAGRGAPLWGLSGPTGARGVLIDAVRRGAPLERRWAALALGVLERRLADRPQASSPETVSVLRAALARAASSEEIGVNALALGLARAVEAREEVGVKLADLTGPESYGKVALGLGLMNDRGSITALTDRMCTSKFQPQLLVDIAVSRALLGDKEVIPELVTMLGMASGLSSQAGIATALGRVGDVRAIDPLLALLEDHEKTERARAFAAQALGVLADRSMIKPTARYTIDANYRAVTETQVSSTFACGVFDQP